MMIAVDFNYTILLENFGFLCTYTGRGLFQIYAGTNLWMLTGTTGLITQ